MNGRDAIYANRRARKWNSGEFKILNGWLIPSKKVDVSLILRKTEDKLIVVVSGHPETREQKTEGEDICAQLRKLKLKQNKFYVVIVQRLISLLQ